MKRTGLYRPTIEDCLELSGIEALHPGGMALTRRTAQVVELRPGMTVLDVASGRGTQSVYYAAEYGASVTGIDLSREMVRTAEKTAEVARLADRVRFLRADSQALPFGEATFDAVINECAVGIPEDSQKVLDEMLRVLKPGGTVVIHESTWLKALPAAEKADLAERYGTTPLERNEWTAMLRKAGAKAIRTELDPWSKPEMFWKIRKDRDVRHYKHVLRAGEKVMLLARIAGAYGLKGIVQAYENEEAFYRAVLEGKLGYGLYWGKKT